MNVQQTMLAGMLGQGPCERSETEAFSLCPMREHFHQGLRMPVRHVRHMYELTEHPRFTYDASSWYWYSRGGCDSVSPFPTISHLEYVLAWELG